MPVSFEVWPYLRIQKGTEHMKNTLTILKAIAVLLIAPRAFVFLAIFNSPV